MSDKENKKYPLIVKLAVAMTFFNSWVLFEETVVDRFGLWQYLPFYKVGIFCAWDATALLIIIPFVWLAFRRFRETKDCFLKLKKCVVCN